MAAAAFLAEVGAIVIVLGAAGGVVIACVALYAATVWLYRVVAAKWSIR